MTQLREDLKVIIISQVHEMKTLEDFFEGIPVVDLYFLEHGYFNQSEDDQNASEDEERRRRKEIEDNNLNSANVVYRQTDEMKIVDECSRLVARLHNRNDIAGDFFIFLASKEVGLFFSMGLVPAPAVTCCIV